MGPGFGNDIGKSAVAAMVVIVIGAAGIAIALWEFAKWIFRHLEIGWN